MDVNLTPDALSMLSNQEQQTMDFKPVVQVTDIWIVSKYTPTVGSSGEDYDQYKIMISDASYCHPGRLDYKLNHLIRSQKLQKGSIVQLTGFVCRWLSNTMTITVNEVKVIVDKCDIIGDPKPMNFHGLFHAEKAKQKTKCDFQNPSKKQRRESSNPKNLVVPEVATSIDARMTMEKNKQDSNARTTMEKNKEDDDDVVGNCIEKLEKLGWKTQDPMLYDTAILLFTESGVYRKLWLHLLNPDSCGKWVRIAGSKYGLLG